MDICVIGAGYVGLVTSACFAHLGNNVTAVDANPERLGALERGEVPFYEPGLDQFIKDCVATGRLKFSGKIEPAVKKSQVIFIAVGTPPSADGDPDLSAVMAVAREIGRSLDSSKHRIIVNKSTVPVGSGNWVEMLVTQGVRSLQPVPARPSKSELPTFSVVSNPEFLREGSAITDSLYPDRIVVGASDGAASEIMERLYEPLISQNFAAPSFAPRPADLETPQFVTTDVCSAELIKYSANAFLAMKISFANEVAGLCEKVGADIRQIARGIGLDKRIGERFLNAGIGWGGSCFGKDVAALMHVAREYNHPTPLLEATVSVNERQRLSVIKKLQDELKIIKGRTIALMGLAFKPDTDDLRDAPAITIAKSLTRMGARVKVYDPVSNDMCKRLHPELDVIYCEDLEELSEGSDALVLVTEWNEFKNADWNRLRELIHTPLVVDGRNVLDQHQLIEAGFSYRGIGH
jgi:UDPglucose 6-dehydrogenase